MQKAFIAIVLALTLSCVASYSTNAAGWVKTPVKVIEDTDINFTNRTRTLSLGSLTSLTDLNLLGYKQPVSEDGCPKDSLTSCDFALSYKPVATKDLSAKTNGSYGFKASDESSFLNGYAYEAFRANDSSSIPQIVLAQTKLEGGNVLPQITLTSNTKAEVKPSFPASVRSGKTVMVLVRYNQTINFTSYTIGGSSKGKEFQFLANTNITGFSLVWGEALSSSQAYLGYKDGDAYKVVVLDFGSGTQIGAGSLASYDKNMDCSPYVTDKKLYGAVCTNTTTSDDKKSKNITVFTSSANTTLAPLFTVVNATSGYKVLGGIPYSGYLGFFHINSTNASASTLDKQIWDLSTGKTFVNQTNVLTYDSAADNFRDYRIPGAGIYGVLYNQNATSNRSNIQLGQIMAGSSLTTVFGFLMTIVAGLFLF